MDLIGWSDQNEDDLIPTKLSQLKRQTQAQRTTKREGNKPNRRPASRRSFRPPSAALPRTSHSRVSRSSSCSRLSSKFPQITLCQGNDEVTTDFGYQPMAVPATRQRRIRLGSKGNGGGSHALVGRLRGPCFSSPSLLVGTVPCCKLQWKGRSSAGVIEHAGDVAEGVEAAAEALHASKGRLRSSFPRKHRRERRVVRKEEEAEECAEERPRAPSTYKLGVYGEVLVWVDDRVVRTEETFKEEGLALEHDHVSSTNQDCKEIDPLEEFIRPKPVYTFRGAKSRLPPTLVRRKDRPRWDRPRPKGKHSVCLLVRISGLDAEEFGEADERAIKQMLCAFLYFVKFLTIERNGETESRNIRHLHFDDISIYMKQEVCMKLKPEESRDVWQRDSEKRMKLGVEIWVKPTDTNKVASTLSNLAKKGHLREAIGKYCPSIVYANRRNQFIPVNPGGDSAGQAEDLRLLADQQSAHTLDLLTPLGFEYNPTAVLSSSGGMSMYNLTLRIQAGLEIDEADLSRAREELKERAMECKLTKKQFEHDSLNAESTYHNAITRVHASRDALYEKLIEKGGLDDIVGTEIDEDEGKADG